MINKLLDKVVKDFTVMKCIAVDTNSEQPFTNKQLFNFCSKALKNYIKFRLMLMKNDKVQEIEASAIKLAVKAGISYAESKFGVDIPSKSEECIEKIAVEVAGAINQRRIDIFTYGLEWATDGLSQNEDNKQD